MGLVVVLLIGVVSKISSRWDSDCPNLKRQQPYLQPFGMICVA